MVTIATRLGGALLALLGLALTVVGVWFATRLGGSGTAEFTLRPQGTAPVVIGPDVLNRVDAPVHVTATPASGGTAWVALANPSDARAVLADGPRTEVTGVSVSDWSLTTSARGSGAAADLQAAELWRNEDSTTGPVSMTVEQRDAPESVVVSGTGRALQGVTLTVTNKAWFVESVVAALVGLFLVVAGVLLLWPRHRRAAHPVTPAEPTPATAPDQEVSP